MVRSMPIAMSILVDLHVCLLTSTGVAAITTLRPAACERCSCKRPCCDQRRGTHDRWQVGANAAQP
jgi:hypothetical protein